MAKRYEKASLDVVNRIAELRRQYYADIEVVTVGALFVYDTVSNLPILAHQGYSAAAVVRVTSARDRAAGMPDAQIVVDRATWQDLTSQQKNALIDHELYHLEVETDGETPEGKPRLAYDAQDRPKLKIRKHDRQFGWFDEIADRHGGDSMEVRQARRLLESTGQLYFEFKDAAA